MDKEWVVKKKKEWVVYGCKVELNYDICWKLNGSGIIMLSKISYTDNDKYYLLSYDVSMFKCIPVCVHECIYVCMCSCVHVCACAVFRSYK